MTPQKNGDFLIEKNKSHEEKINKFDHIYIKKKKVCSRKDTTDKTTSKLHT